MADQPKRSPEDDLRQENTALKIRISSLEADVRIKDQEIAHLRKPRLSRRDPQAIDAFSRPYRGR